MASWRYLPPALPALVLGGCYSQREIRPEELRRLDRTAAVRIETRSGEELRALVGPGDVGPATLRYQRLRYGPRSWVVRLGGWPLVYTSGKYLRFQSEADRIEILLEEVKAVRLEKYDWGLTLLTLPLTLPVGLVDFLVHHIRFGFEDVDIDFDRFSRDTPASAARKRTMTPP